ncbi:SLC13 family permease [uncultured Oscillibacter sp.]|uniref:SLC13 family permease n=1 Tax=uncultured Oscillibacter sp. TaxID=876091 RepID=UPI0025F862F0|nr:SLC13 family permease [uncultured Oscillibacter sp.]
MKGKHISRTIQSIAALLFIFVLGNFIPTWSTVSRMGVQYICIMVGWIWLCVLCGGLLLPSAMAMVGCLLPGYFTPATLVSATLGNTITVLMIFIFILVYIFQKSKTGDFLVRWMLSRRMVNGRPYLFTAVFLVGIVVIGSVIGSFGIILLTIAILGAICDVSGMEKTNDWVRFMLLSVVALSGVTEIMYPFKPYAVLYNSIFDAQLTAVGTQVSGTTWTITAVVISVLSLVLLMLLARFVFRFDMSRLRSLDVSLLQTEEFKRMSKQQIIVLVSVIITFFYPFILQIMPQGNVVYDLLNNVGQYFAMAFVVCLLCLIPVDGEPICEINEVFKNGTNWGIIFGVGAVLALGGALSSDEAGVSNWLLSIFENLFGGMSPAVVIAIVAVLGCFVTQFFSNSATAILFLTALAPLSVSLYQQGVNVSVFPPIIGIGTLTACLLPSGSGQSAIMLGTDIFAGDGQKWALSKGILVLLAVTVGIVAAGVLCITIL